jgi:hypothetical protein
MKTLTFSLTNGKSITADFESNIADDFIKKFTSRKFKRKRGVTFSAVNGATMHILLKSVVSIEVEPCKQP